MLWRARTTLTDRPGSLAHLASACGEAGVNILGVQIFPDVDSVTDELVLRTPGDWGLVQVARLLEEAGGRRVSVMECSESALVDQPTRYVQAAHTVLAQPAAFPDVAARLFEAEADLGTSPYAEVQDVLEMAVGDVTVQVRRTAVFTPIERARAAALAELVTDVLGKAKEQPLPAPGRRLGTAHAPTYTAVPHGVEARLGETLIGTLRMWIGDEADVREVSLEVDPPWRRRGIGTRLLLTAARRAAEQGAAELVLRTAADNQAVLPVVLSAGLRSRIRMTGDRLVVRMPLTSLRSSTR